MGDEDDVCLAHRDELNEALYGSATSVPDLLYRKWAGLPIYEGLDEPAGKAFRPKPAGWEPEMAKAKKPAGKGAAKKGGKKGC